MLDVKNPEIDVDQVRQQVEEKVRLRRAVTSAPPTVAPPVAANSAQGEWSMTHELLARARETSQMGAALPPMSRVSGIKRVFALAVAKVFLRIAQLITRDQRAFNQAVLDVFHHLDGRLLKIHSELETRTAQEAAARAAVQGEITGLGAELTGLRKEMGGLRELAAAPREIAALRAELETRLAAAPREIAALRAELETRLAALQQDLANGRQSEAV